MDKHAKTEQDLSEELLQQITGGCAACDEDKTWKKHWEDQTDRSSWLAEAAAAKGDLRTAKGLWEDAMDSAGLARLRQANIDARRGTPGHPPVLGESSSSESPAKRPRL
jgi:hypothetical protein